MTLELQYVREVEMMKNYVHDYDFHPSCECDYDFLLCCDYDFLLYPGEPKIKNKKIVNYHTYILANVKKKTGDSHRDIIQPY